MAFQIKQNSKLHNYLEVAGYQFPVKATDIPDMIEDLSQIREVFEPGEPSEELRQDALRLKDFLGSLVVAEIAAE